MQQLNEKQFPDYVLGSLQYSAVRWDELPHVIDRALEWYKHLTGLGHYHLPFFIVMDLGILIEKGYSTPFRSDRDYKLWSEEHRSVRLRYENEILGRLLQEPMMLEILEFLQMSKEINGRRLRLMELLLNSLAAQYPRTCLVHPAHIRSVQLTPNDIAEHAEREQRFLTSMEDPRFFIDRLSQFLEGVAHHIQWSELLRKEDLFELRHWHILDTEEIRIGCRQILEVERRLGEVDTRSIQVNQEDSDSETAFVDETYYPTGGVTELTNRGSFENLVLSELIYMSDDPTQQTDLFDIRYIEGELLYYLRDSGQLRRKRRTVHLIIDLGQLFQFKTTGYDYQFSILTQGLLLRLTRDLLSVFANDAMQFHFHYVTQHFDPEPLQREMQLMRLLLSDEEQHGWVDFHIMKTLDLKKLEEDKRKVYAVAITSDGTHWDTLFADYQRCRPAILGVSIHVQNEEKNSSNEVIQESTFALPFQGMPFERVIALKNRIIAQIADLKAY